MESGGLEPKGNDLYLDQQALKPEAKLGF